MLLAIVLLLLLAFYVHAWWTIFDPVVYFYAYSGV
jgi:hypothetical protein